METKALLDDSSVVARVLDHIDHRTTDLGATTWREPVENYRSEARFRAERDRVLRRHPVAFCPSPAIPSPGSYLAREAAGTPLLAVRGSDGVVRAFRNACRHRGTELASGAGCAKAFVCRYHAWTYGLDGALCHVPHEEGFPDLDKAARGLVPVAAVEAAGVVFVTQEPASPADASPGELPPLLPQHFRLLGSADLELAANWKILVEGFLEGYHIRATHPATFYPVQYDNLNVVETFGRNSRIVFPYRAIEKLRAVPPAERASEGKLTYVHHLFPNTMVASFPGRLLLVVVEPLAIDRSRLVTYLLTDRDETDADAQTKLARGRDFVTAGGLEDNEVARAIQRSLPSGANEFFEFGLFEKAIVHFHQTLAAALSRAF